MAQAYTLPPLGYPEQLAQLEQRGLQVTRRTEALEVLATVGYTRLSGFWKPLQIPESNNFAAGASFEQIYDRYQFDSRIRQLILYAVGHIEVAIRSALVYHISHELGTGLWVADTSVFGSAGRQWQSGFVQRTLNDLWKSREPWAQHYMREYGRETPVPPAWIALQFASFGDLAEMLTKLKLVDARAAVCQRYELHHEVLISWIKTLRSLRNAAAHHARLWNRNLQTPPKWPKQLELSHRQRPSRPWVSTWAPDPNIATAPFTRYRNLGGDGAQHLTLYAAICTMKYLIDCINPRNSFRSRLEACLSPHLALGHPVDVEAGFPVGWRGEPLWVGGGG